MEILERLEGQKGDIPEAFGGYKDVSLGLQWHVSGRF